MTSSGGITYTYDANGERLTKTVGSDTYSYYYDGVNLLFTKKNGAYENQYLYDNGEIFGAVDENDVAYWYCYDIRGSITKVMKGDTNTSISTTLYISYVYDAYGDTSTTTAEGSTFRNDIAYTGAIIDQETGLYYLMSRYYDPSIGQFISEDSYRGEGDAFWHLYAYCDGDPVNKVDVNGFSPRDITGYSRTFSEPYIGGKIELYVKEYTYKGVEIVEPYRVSAKITKFRGYNLICLTMLTTCRGDTVPDGIKTKSRKFKFYKNNPKFNCTYTGTFRNGYFDRYSLVNAFVRLDVTINYKVKKKNKSTSITKSVALGNVALDPSQSWKFKGGR